MLLFDNKATSSSNSAGNFSASRRKYGAAAQIKKGGMHMYATKEIIERMVADRRHIHKRPEEGWTEFETTAFVVERLRSLGFEVLTGPKILNTAFVMGRDPELVKSAQERARQHGISEALLAEMDGWTGAVAVFDTSRPGPVTAFRMDLDCVCVQETDDPSHEANLGGYASERPGLMHACGHDGHTAVGLAVAEWVKEHADELCGRFKFIFQPAEEGTRGAEPLAESGVADDIDYLVCSHIGTGYKIGEIAVCHRGFLATTKIDVRFTGRAAHAGTAPEKGRSALLAAASCATLLSGISRSAQGDTRISIGRLVAGEGRNVVPVHAYMQLETRGTTEEVNQFMVENVHRIVEGTAKSFDVEASIEPVGHATVLEADQEVTDDLMAIAKEIPFVHKVDRNDGITGSEDVTMICRRVRAHGGKVGFFIFGCNEHGHHKGDFCIQDEESLREAFEMDVRFVLRKNRR